MNKKGLLTGGKTTDGREYKIEEVYPQYHAVFVKVPMNNLPGCSLHFWQQCSKAYFYRAYAVKQMVKKMEVVA